MLQSAIDTLMLAKSGQTVTIEIALPPHIFQVVRQIGNPHLKLGWVKHWNILIPFRFV
jgi:hypothetical protein